MAIAPVGSDVSHQISSKLSLLDARMAEMGNILRQINLGLSLLNARLDAFSSNMGRDLDAIDAKLHRLQAQCEHCLRRVDDMLVEGTLQILYMRTPSRK